MSNRLQSDKGRLEGESELHFQARKTYHRANRVLKRVDQAMVAAHKAHLAWKQAVARRKQQMIAQQAAELASKEREKKSEERRKARGIKTKEEYAAKLADEALNAGENAEELMRKAARAGVVVLRT